MLMMTNKGNLDQIRAELQDWRVGDIVDHEPQSQLNAEIVAGVEPKWHVLETLPNHERTVASHLIARRFGMFVPETEEDIIRRGRKIHVTRLMFTGYVFVFVWDIKAHADRLMMIPGVSRLMCHPGIDGGFPQPVSLSDAVIDKIRAVENTKRPLTLVFDDIEENVSKKKRKNRWRRKAKSQTKLEIVNVRPWDAFQDAIATLDSDGRNQTLMHALGLSS